ncbi:hypothetical protein TNCV_2474601 [Trichonephila clavipes]|nr:hypothetical protein TNCV_2474601 [Trichonephila clavipes]
MAPNVGLDEPRHKRRPEERTNERKRSLVRPWTDHNHISAPLKQPKEGQTSPDDPFPVHYKVFQLREDHSGPDECRPDSSDTVHQQELQQWKDQYGPDESCQKDQGHTI